MSERITWLAGWATLVIGVMVLVMLFVNPASRRRTLRLRIIDGVMALGFVLAGSDVALRSPAEPWSAVGWTGLTLAGIGVLLELWYVVRTPPGGARRGP